LKDDQSTGLGKAFTAEMAACQRFRATSAASNWRQRILNLRGLAVINPAILEALSPGPL
jgi:hypothetical protein